MSCTVDANTNFGVATSNLTLSGGEVSNNESFGIALNGGTVSNCTVEGNGSYGIGATGGSITNVIVNGNTGTGINAANATISLCTIENNMYTNGSGGGVVLSGTSSVTDSTILGNSASINGGGVYCTGGASGNPNVVKDCLIALNSASGNGGGVYASGYATFANNTIGDNGSGGTATAGGVALVSTSGVSLANNIIADNSSGIMSDTGRGITLSHNDVFGNTGFEYSGLSAGAGDIALDPLFVNHDNYDYHLSPGSPCINAGDDTYVVSGDEDLDGNTRIQGSHVDIGCYETSAVATATLTSISPSSVQAGDNSFTLTVTGTGFVSGGTVDWNGTALSTTYSSATKLTATVPASLVATAGTASVTELNPGASASNAKTFTITAAATITSLSPTSKPADSATFTLTVTGTNFLPGAVVYWNTAGLTTTEISSTELTAIVPASDLTTVGTDTITAANPHTAATNALMFTVTTPVAAITSLSPSSIAAGSAEFILSVNGSNFVSGSVVKWNGAALQTAYFNGTILAALVPASDVASAGTASVTVANPGVAASNALTFTITGTTAAPTITSFSPTSGPIGTVVTIVGTNLNGVTAVRFHNASATVFSANAAGTQLTVMVPSGAGTGTITVTTPGGSVKTATNFTVILPPTVTSFTPTSGPIGTVVTVTGTNLNGVTAVRFHNANASVFSANAGGTQMTVTVPTGAGTGTFSITTPGGTVKTTGTFTVN